MKAQVEKIFDDLDNYLDFCRLELREFNPAHLYDKSNDNYRAFTYSQRPPRQWQDRTNGGHSPNYRGNKPYRDFKRNDSFSR